MTNVIKFPFTQLDPEQTVKVLMKLWLALPEDIQRLLNENKPVTDATGMLWAECLKSLGILIALLALCVDDSEHPAVVEAVTQVVWDQIKEARGTYTGETVDVTDYDE